MRKILLLVSTVFLSLFIINDKVYAQEFPNNLLKIPFSAYYYEKTNQDTYEYTIEYILEDWLIFELEEIDYYFITKDNQHFHKYYDSQYNSYVLEDIYTWVDYFTRGTLITLRVTVNKEYIENNYGNPYNYEDVLPFFRDNSALYVNYYIPDTTGYQRGFSDGYDIGYSEGYDHGLQVGEQAGYNIGYNEGYNNGYNKGYTDGTRATQAEAYQKGYNDGYEVASNTAISKFTSNFHVWIVPAIILVIVAGIFTGYRRERRLK